MEQKGKESKNSKIKRKLFAIAVTLCLCATCSPLTGGVAFARESDAAKATMPQESNFTSMQECKAGYIPVQATRCTENEIQTLSLEDEFVSLAMLNSANALNVINTSPIADIETEESRYCRQQLASTDSELINLYDVIRDALNTFASEIQIEGVSRGNDAGDHYTADEVWMAYTLVKEDYPEFFWLDIGYGYSPYFLEDGQKVEYEENTGETKYVESLEPGYLFDNVDAVETAQDELNAKIQEALSVLRGYDDYEGYNEYDKELWVHDYIAKTTEYEESATNCHTVYGALVEGKAVCEGYTRAFQLLLNELGIENCTIAGSSDGEKANHIWNAVRIPSDAENESDNWYQVDLTWDDQGTEDYEISYRWFNIMGETMKIDHCLIEESNYVEIPSCTGVDAWYYYVNSDMTVPEENIGDVDMDNLAWKISEQIKDYGYARLFVPYRAEEIGDLYMCEDEEDNWNLGSLGEKVFNCMYISGQYTFGMRSYCNGGEEMLLFMYPDEDTGSIYAADVWDMICQEDDKEDVVIRAYPVGTSEKDIAAMIKKEKGNKVSQDYKCVSEAALSDMGIWDETGLYLAMFSFEAIPLGEYDVAIYKPGYPLIFYDLKVEEGGITRNSALKLGSWYINSFGDVDCDWDVNAADALILKRHIAGWTGYEEDKINTNAANINGDDEINIEDLMLLEKHIAGWTGFEDLSSYWKAS